VTDPRPVHRHVWNGGQLPAWLDDQHHHDNGQLVIHTPDGHAQPKPGWTLIAWTDGTITTATPTISEREYGPAGAYQQLAQAEKALSLVRTIADLIADGCPVYASRDELAKRLRDAATLPEPEPDQETP
jgi:hypothetical protein